MTIIAHVGIDVHEETLVICGLVGQEKRPAFRTTISNNKGEIKRTFLKLSAQYDLRCCYEASSCGFVLHRWLDEIGIACDVVAPSQTPKKPGERVKTDKRDALKLAELYRAGLLTTVHIPTPEQEADRRLVRFRLGLVKDVIKSKNAVNKFLTSHGVRPPFKSRWTQKYWAWLNKLDFGGSEQFVFSQMLAILQMKLSFLSTADAQLAGLANKEEYKDKVAKLCCLRGVAVLSALTLVLEIMDPRRFASHRSAMAYCGLTSSEYSSGKSRKQGGITKNGNSYIRRILVEAAWKYARKPAVGAVLKARQVGQPPEVIAHAWKAQHRLYKKFHSVAAHKPRPVAVVATARELVGFVLAVIDFPVAVA